ncbi:MAG: serine O-acetyltransferase [Myxococcota bacterium]
MSDDDPSLIGAILEDLKANGRDWTKPGFRALAVYRFGVWRMSLEPRAARMAFGPLYWSAFRFVRNFYGIEIPYSAKLGRRVVVEHQGGIVVHGNAEIGDDTIIRQGVTIGNKNLDEPMDAPRIGARVNIGAGAKILGKLEIGDDAAVGANSVVVKDVPAGATVVGIPAKEIPKKP